MSKVYIWPHLSFSCFPESCPEIASWEKISKLNFLHEEFLGTNCFTKDDWVFFWTIQVIFLSPETSSPGFSIIIAMIIDQDRGDIVNITLVLETTMIPIIIVVMIMIIMMIINYKHHDHEDIANITLILEMALGFAFELVGLIAIRPWIRPGWLIANLVVFYRGLWQKIGMFIVDDDHDTLKGWKRPRASGEKF